MRSSRNLVVVAALLLAPVAAGGSEPNLALVRVESLDAVLGDVERLAALTGREMTRQQLSEQLGGAMGGTDVSWLDPGRPWFVVASTAALVQGPQSLVVAVPVRDREAAAAALEGRWLDQAADSDGVRMLDSGRQMPMATVFRDGYLVASPGRETALAFRPGEHLERGDLPPGNVAVDVYLEPVAPMALSGLEAARAMLEQQIADTPDEFLVEGDEEVWEEEGWDEEASEGDAGENDEESPEPSAAAEGAAGEQDEVSDEVLAAKLGSVAVSTLIDLYVDLLRNLIANASRMQMSVELGDRHLLVHQRVVPVAGSTLEGLLAAQQGGLPALARFVEPGDSSAFVMAGQVTPTPAFLAATKQFLRRYQEAMESVFDEVEGGGEELPGAALLRATMQDIERWPDCYRGDFAAAFELGEESFSGVQVVGVEDAEVCQALIEQLAAMAALWAGQPAAEGAAALPAEAEPLVYKGVRAVGYEMDMAAMALELEEDESLPGWMRQKMVSYTGIQGDLLLTAAGPDAGASFRGLVDRVAGEPAGGGLTAERFAPLSVGAGVFAAIDFSSMAESLPAEADDRVAELLDGIGEEAPMLYGARLLPGALHAQFALPLSFLGAAARLSAESAAAAPPAPADP